VDGTNGFVLTATGASTDMGWYIVGRLDLNRDGKNDLAVSDLGYNTNRGRAWVLFNRPTYPASIDLNTLNGSNGFILDGATTSDRFGYSMSKVGDFNGDGYHDFAIGTKYAYPDSGASFIYILYSRSTYPSLIPINSIDNSTGYVMKMERVFGRIIHDTKYHKFAAYLYGSNQQAMYTLLGKINQNNT
jgi:FG-GAP repeat